MAESSDINAQAGTESDVLVRGILSVFQHLDNLIRIRPRELLFEPNTGLDIEQLLFKFVDDITAQAIYTRLTSKIRSLDDRITITGRSNVVAYPNNSPPMYSINMVVAVRGLDQTYEYTGTLYPHERSNL